MARHKWKMMSGGNKCEKCGLKMTFKAVPAKKIINGNKKVTKAFFQPKGGASVQADKTPPCAP